MERGYFLLIIICLIAIGLLLFNIKVMIGNKHILFKRLCIGLFSYMILRYLTLIVYGGDSSYEQLKALRYFYPASLIGIMIPTLLAIWYITPLYRHKITCLHYLCIFLPWITFYCYIIITQPTVILKGENFGYSLGIVNPYRIYLITAQLILMGIVLILSIVGMIKHKNLQIRVQLFMIIIAQTTLLLDVVSYLIKIPQTFSRFTISEVFVLVALFYAFSKKIIEVKGIHNN